jgi:hypothetical protein
MVLRWDNQARIDSQAASDPLDMQTARRKKIIHVLTRINQLVREQTLISMEGRIDTCLPTCLVLMEVLKSAQFQCKLIPCKCEIRNNLKDGEYWGIGIERHLIVSCYDQVLLDPSLDQASRPEKKINLAPLLHETPYTEWQVSQGLVLQHNGCSLRYLGMNPWHLNAPDYTTKRLWKYYIDDANRVIERLKAEELVR